MKKVTSMGVLCMALVLIGVSDTSFGSLFYSNFDTPSADCGSLGYWSVPGFGSGGTRRSTDAGYTGENAWLLSYVELCINMVSGSPDDLHVYLYEGLGPQTMVTELFASETVGTEQAIYSFQPSGDVYLTAHTFYSLVVEPAFVPGTSIAWYYAPDVYGADYSDAEGTTWGPWENGTDAPTVRVYAETVPEPTTLGLFAIGGLTVLLCAKRPTKQEARAETKVT
jgi:hypothetical protein